MNLGKRPLSILVLSGLYIAFGNHRLCLPLSTAVDGIPLRGCMD